MKNLLLPLLLLGVVLAVPHSASSAESDGLPQWRTPSSIKPDKFPEIDKQLAQKVDTCQVLHPTKHVFFFKQWHLAPSADTRTEIAQSMEAPQHDNQLAIFIQLDRWVRNKKAIQMYAEGCAWPQDITMSSSDKFNGWTVADLSKKADDLNFADIMTNIGYKISARWKNQARVRCGDDSDAMKSNLRAFSDARGILGYLTRLEQNRKNPEGAKIYLEGVVELYHLSKDTTVDQAIFRLNLELKKSVDAIEHWIDVRNQRLVDAIMEDDSKFSAVVFGGAHAAGVRKLLEKRGVGCSIVEPWGYRDDELEMLDNLRHLVNDRLKPTT